MNNKNLKSYINFKRAYEEVFKETEEYLDIISRDLDLLKKSENSFYKLKSEILGISARLSTAKSLFGEFKEFLLNFKDKNDE